jgi:hypothetical protein
VKDNDNEVIGMGKAEQGISDWGGLQQGQVTYRFLPLKRWSSHTKCAVRRPLMQSLTGKFLLWEDLSEGVDCSTLCRVRSQALTVQPCRFHIES